MSGTFRRDWLPSWEAYAAQHVPTLHGQGAERRAVCGIHCGDRDSLVINVTSGAWCCHACDTCGGDVLAYHRAVTGAGFIEAARALGAWSEQRDDSDRPPKAICRPVEALTVPGRDEDADRAWKRALATRLWAQSLPIGPETPAGQYLIGRCCVLPRADSDLRWHPDVQVFGFGGVAMVGRMSFAADYREARGLHVTWLEPDGSGWRRGQRRYLGPKAGCVVRLWPDEAVTLGLGVAEGIESALSLAHAFAPVWACLDAANLGTLPVLGGIEALTIAADNDENGIGIAAARACASRWTRAGAAVRIVMTEGLGDANDLVRAP